jgi:fumarate hydratase class II
MNFREEKDSMGTVIVPENVYYGAQTQRAAENFPVSGLRFPSSMIRSLALIKKCAAQVNRGLGLLRPDTAEAILSAAEEVIDGRWDDQFVVDVFQTGSGTSTNMNMNEVLATRANEILTGKKAGKSPVHPNDHVNMGQSSNDMIPSAIHIAAFCAIKEELIPPLEGLREALSAKAAELMDVKKIGRTHLQDAVPMRLGQEFSGYARQIALGIERISATGPRLSELALGGTAVGSGLNAHPEFAPRVIEMVSALTKIDFKEAENHFEAQAAQDASVEVSGALKTVAVSLFKIANDIRWLSSGPRCGIGEISIPSLQPGSSIMPGKVNPVIPESVIQTAAQIIGNDTAITLGGQGGIFELNVMLPVIAYNLLQSIRLLGNAARILCDKCVKGIQANRRTCEGNVERSLAMVTGLVPLIGYDRAAEIAKSAFESGKTVREVALEKKVLPEEELNRALDRSSEI